MEKPFDLRQPLDREELASFLPTFDAQTIDVPGHVFVEALQDVSTFLGEPNWLTYQWGIVGPLRDGKAQYPLDFRCLLPKGLRRQSRRREWTVHRVEVRNT